jgi:hypothetical protein
MIIRTIKTNGGRNVIVLRPENGKGVRLELTQAELRKLTYMLYHLSAVESDGTDHLIEERETRIELKHFRGI